MDPQTVVFNGAEVEVVDCPADLVEWVKANDPICVLRGPQEYWDHIRAVRDGQRAG